MNIVIDSRKSPLLAPPVHPVRLPLAEARCIFEEHHVPRIRPILTENWERVRLLDRHAVGVGFNFVKDHEVHRSDENMPALSFFCNRFGIVEETMHTRLWQAGKLAAGLDARWIEAACRDVKLGTALVIVEDGYGLLAGPIRHLLFELAYQPGERSRLHAAAPMRLVCHHLRARADSFRGETIPDRAVLLEWIDAILAPRRPPRREQRQYPRKAEQADRTALEQEVKSLAQTLASMQKELAALRSGTSHPADPCDPAGPGHPTSGRPSAPGRAADPADPVHPEHQDAGSAALPDDRPPRVRQPFLLSESDDALPVHYPGFPLSSFELLTCEIIVACAELARQGIQLIQGRYQPGHAISVLLQLRTDRAADRFIDHCEAIRALIKDAAAIGLSHLKAQADPDGDIHLPVHTDYFAAMPPDFHPIAWVVVQERDPLNDPCPERLEPLVWRTLGVFEALHQRLGPWLAQRNGGALCDATLLYQLDQALFAARGQSYRLRHLFYPGVGEGLRCELEQGRTEARLDFFAAAPVDPNLVILGSDEPVPALSRLGLDKNGRHLALSLFTSQLVLALGGRGWGKSHLGRLIAESLHLHLPGVNRLSAPLSSVTFEVDHNLGQGRRQMLRGMFPNPKRQQLQQLRAYFGCNVDNAALRPALLRCLPASVKPLRAELPACLERGLMIEPVEAGPQNLGQVGWEAILGSAFSRGPDRPVYADHLAALIGIHGDQLTPEVLIAEIETNKEFARVRSGLIHQLMPLCGLVRRGADVRDDLKLGYPIFYLLECQHLPESFLLGLLVAILHGLAQPTGRPQDETMLWLFCDELSKLVQLPVVARLLLAIAKELRHRKVSLFLGGQSSSGLSAEFLGLVSVFFVFHLASRAGFAPLQELEYFRGVSYERVRELVRGQALVGAVNSTDPLLRQMAQWMWLRPTFIDAGGESLTLG